MIRLLLIAFTLTSCAPPLTLEVPKDRQVNTFTRDCLLRSVEHNELAGLEFIDMRVDDGIFVSGGTTHPEVAMLTTDGVVYLLDAASQGVKRLTCGPMSNLHSDDRERGQKFCAISGDRTVVCFASEGVQSVELPHEITEPPSDWSPGCAMLANTSSYCWNNDGAFEFIEAGPGNPYRDTPRVVVVGRVACRVPYEMAACIDTITREYLYIPDLDSTPIRPTEMHPWYGPSPPRSGVMLKHSQGYRYVGRRPNDSEFTAEPPWLTSGPQPRCVPVGNRVLCRNVHLTVVDGEALGYWTGIGQHCRNLYEEDTTYDVVVTLDERLTSVRDSNYALCALSTAGRITCWGGALSDGFDLPNVRWLGTPDCGPVPPLNDPVVINIETTPSGRRVHRRVRRVPPLYDDVSMGLHSQEITTSP